MPLAAGLDAAIRNHVARLGVTGYLFPGEYDGHFGPTWLGKLINRQLPEPWTPHGLGHRFTTTKYQQTRDLIVVQQLLGHESVATTQRAISPTTPNSSVPLSTSPHDRKGFRCRD